MFCPPYISHQVVLTAHLLPAADTPVKTSRANKFSLFRILYRCLDFWELNYSPNWWICTILYAYSFLPTILYSRPEVCSTRCFINQPVTSDDQIGSNSLTLTEFSLFYLFCFINSLRWLLDVPNMRQYLRLAYPQTEMHEPQNKPSETRHERPGIDMYIE